jgi:tRNA modification GTPase
VCFLRDHLKSIVGYNLSQEGVFIARRRHLDILQRVQNYLQQAYYQITLAQPCSELLAEELRLAQNTLSEITGEFRSDDLLGEIFSNFCIGK